MNWFPFTLRGAFVAVMCTNDVRYTPVGINLLHIAKGVAAGPSVSATCYQLFPIGVVLLLL